MVIPEEGGQGDADRGVDMVIPEGGGQGDADRGVDMVIPEGGGQGDMVIPERGGGGGQGDADRGVVMGQGGNDPIQQRLGSRG